MLFLFYPSASFSTVFVLLMNMYMYKMNKKSLNAYAKFSLKCLNCSFCSFFVAFSDVHPLVLCFRVKYYPTDPLMLKEELTR